MAGPSIPMACAGLHWPAVLCPAYVVAGLALLCPGPGPEILGINKSVKIAGIYDGGVPASRMDAPHYFHYHDNINSWKA